MTNLSTTLALMTEELWGTQRSLLTSPDPSPFPDHSDHIILSLSVQFKDELETVPWLVPKARSIKILKQLGSEQKIQ